MITVRLCNPPGTLQSLINSSIRKYLDVFANACVDHILCFCETRDEYIQQIRKLLQRMSDNKFQLDKKKCRFLMHEVKYLGVYISI